MLVFAAGTMEKLRHVPLKNLANLGLAILILVVAVFLIKRAAKMNRIILVIVGTMIVIVVTMTWVYQRNEPKVLSPVIDFVRPFFPSAPPPLSSRPEPGIPSAPKKPQAPPPAPTPTTTIRPKTY
jgi:hypothetical protein